jgi:hypothetical protein
MLPANFLKEKEEMKLKVHNEGQYCCITNYIPQTKQNSCFNFFAGVSQDSLLGPFYDTRDIWKVQNILY